MLILDFLFGLGIFLYGMSELEKGIRRLSDARLKALLRFGTGTRFSSVGVGIITTAILQSSSMVSLLVLAFASAGLLPLMNAIGIILGANLGTTATGWIVATLGFKLDLEALAVPLVGSSAFILVLVREKTRLHSSANIILGLGLLLFGLGLMKASMESLPEQWDAASFTGRSAFVYLLVGVFIAFLIQSSSAVMMMALAALNTSIIGLPEAAALVIGADLGTTSTTILGSIQGSVIKRKLAFAHFAFNFIVDMAAFILLLPLLPNLLSLIGVSDPLYGLVAFHSTINFVGLLVFMPFLTAYTASIERLFARSAQFSQDILETVPANITDAALIALQKKAIAMELQAISNALQLFGLHPEKNGAIAEIAGQYAVAIRHEGFRQGYENLKAEESNVTQYILDVQLQPLQETQAKALEVYARVVRLLIYSNKTLKDISHDLDEIRSGPDSYLQQYYSRQRQFFKELCAKCVEFLRSSFPQSLLQEELHELDLYNNDHYAQLNQFVHDSIVKPRVDNMALSMLLNVNLEIHHATKQLLESVQGLVTSSEWLTNAQSFSQNPTQPSEDGQG